VHCSSAHIRQVGADAALEGVQPLVRSRYTFPSRLPDPGRLAVPTRPVVVGAAPTHTLRFQGRTAPSFNDPLRRAAVGSLTPLGQSTPRGALRARGTIQASRRGGRTKSPGSKPIAQTGLPACVLPTKPPSRIARPYGRTQTEPPTSIFMPRVAALARLTQARPTAMLLSHERESVTASGGVAAGMAARSTPSGRSCRGCARTR
jgi:hypothetical protein